MVLAYKNGSFCRLGVDVMCIVVDRTIQTLLNIDGETPFRNANFKCEFIFFYLFILDGNMICSQLDNNRIWQTEN